MIKQIAFQEIFPKWEKFKTEFKKAGSSNHLWAKGSDLYFEKYFDSVMNRTFSELKKGTMQLWVSYDSKKPDEINYLCITQITKCPFTNLKSLTIFSVIRTAEVEDEQLNLMWIEAFQQTAKFGLKNGCSNLLAVTGLEYMVQKAKFLSKDCIELTYINFPLVN